MLRSRIFLLRIKTDFGPCRRSQHRQAPKLKPIQKDETVIKKIRNIGIMAHIDAGKTTTTERFLYYSGFTRQIGDVDSGDTVTDYMDQERARGITITAAAISFFWNQHRINLIDTPGHVDFTLEVERSLRVLDGAVAVMDASKGVEAQTLTVWRQADRYSVPRIIYLNKMDKANANFHHSIDSISDKLHIEPLVTQLPLGEQKNFNGIVDLVTMRKYEWDRSDTEGSTYNMIPVNNQSEPSLYEEAYQTRAQLIDRLADVDDSIADKIMSGVDYCDISPLDITRSLRTATIYHNQVPLFCGSSFKNIAVQPLLNNIINLLPDPSERQHKFVNYYKNTLCALAFKIVPNNRHGPVTFIRIYSGNIKTGSSIYNINRKRRETVEKLFQVYADEYQFIQEAEAGNIVAVTGLTETVTGDTLVLNLTSANDATRAWLKDEKAAPAQPKASARVLDEYSDDIDEDEQEESEEVVTAPVLAGLKIPDPVFLCSIEAPSLSQQKILDVALQNLSREDPSLRVETDPDTGQTILSGMGELHLEIIRDRIRKEYKVEAEVGPLVISYREKLDAPIRHSMELDRNIGSKVHKVRMTLTLRPEDNTEQKFVTVNPDDNAELDPNKMRLKTLRAITNGAKSALSRGPLLYFPVIDVSIELNDYKHKYGTSPAMISACAAQCVSQALKKTSTRLLQPMMTLEVLTDEDYVSIVTSELARRGGQLEDVSVRRNLRTVRATTPLAAIMDLSSTLRSITSGTASFSMELSHYDLMTQQETDAAIEKVTGFKPIRTL